MIIKHDNLIAILYSRNVNKETVMASSVSEQKKMTFAVALALVAGAMMIAGGITTILLLHAFQSMFGGGYMMGGGWGMFMTPAHIQYMVYTTSLVSIGIGAVVTAFGYKIRLNPQSSSDYGVAILIASLVGLFTASGFGMGAVFGILAGILAIARK